MSNVKGTVTHAFPIRSMCQANTQQENNGPFGDKVEMVFNVKVRDTSRPDIKPNEITIFFYNRWAERCSFLKRDDILTINGGKNLIKESTELEENRQKGDHRFCLCIGGSNFSSLALFQAGEMFKLTVQVAKTKFHDEFSLEITPENLESIKIPVREAYEGKPKRRKRQKRGRGTELLHFQTDNAHAQDSNYYSYSMLCNVNVCPDLKEEEQKYNVYGVVVNFSFPKPTKGYDWMMTVHLVDPSLPKACQAICVNIFQTRAKLPKLFQIGDILRCHRVHSKAHDAVVYLVGRGRGISSFLAIPFENNGSGPDNDLPLMFSSPTSNFSFTDSDRETINDLERWRDEHFFPMEELCNPQNRRVVEFFLTASKTAASIVENARNELVCMFVNFDANEGIIEVWDGTGNSDPKGHTALLAFLQQHFIPLAGNDFEMAQPHGALLRIFVPSDIQEHAGGFQHLKPGVWLRLRNLEVTSVNSRAACTATLKTFINQIPSVAVEVKWIIENNKKLLPLAPSLSQSSSTNGRLTHASTGEPLSDLSEVIAIPAPHQHVSVAQVSHVWDQDYKDLKIMIRLEDDTANLDAVAFGTQAKTVMECIKDGQTSDLCSNDLFEVEVSSHYLQDETKTFRVDAFRMYVKGAEEHDDERNLS